MRQTSPRKKSLRPSGSPSSLFNCDRPMMMAAAEVKPRITGCDRKLTTLPIRHRASTSWIAPTMKASRMASATNCSEPRVASGARADAVRIEDTAAGPVASWLDDPQSAATITGRKPAYRP